MPPGASPQPRRQQQPRARLGQRGSASGGRAGLGPPGAPPPTVPIIEYRPPPPHRAIWRGLAVPHPPPVILPPGVAVYVLAANTYGTAVAADTPGAWWRLSDPLGSATAADNSGGAHTGTASYVTFGVPGQLTPATAASFNGTTSHITTSYNPGAITAFSVEAWVNLNGAAISGNPRIVANSHTDVDFKGFQLAIIPGPAPAFAVGNGTAAVFFASSATLTAAGWNYLAGTWNGTTATLYLNGVVVASAVLTGTMPVGSNGISIGYDATYTGDYVNGYIDQVAVYSGTALSAARVAAHYAAAFPSAWALAPVLGFNSATLTQYLSGQPEFAMPGVFVPARHTTTTSPLVTVWGNATSHVLQFGAWT